MRKPFFTRLSRKLTREWRERTVTLSTAHLDRVNRRSSRAVVGDAPVVVSLTTHGARIDSVHLTIEAIARGTVRPNRLILWIDEPDRLQNLPDGLVRLQSRGLEVRLSDNFGPHTKYFPALGQLATGQRLVTADDDIIYPRHWLLRLIQAAERNSSDIHCHRAKIVAFDEEGIRPYADWEDCWGVGGYARVFGTGVSGVIYPARMTDALRARGTAFREVAPKADDIWLHAVAVDEGIPVWQVGAAAIHYAATPETQEMGLMHNNVHSTGNDDQIRKTYGPDLVAKIRAGGAVESGGNSA